MNFGYKCYLLKDGIMEEMFITRELLEELNLALSEEEIRKFLKKNEHHYLLIEFYCDKLGIEHKDESKFMSPTSYFEYLNGLLCDNGYITFVMIRNVMNNNITFTNKAKKRYDRSENTVIVHVPYEIEEISEYDISYLNHLRSDLDMIYHI